MDYLIHLTIVFSLLAILALSLNLVVGYTGLLSAAHAVFYGIGAYSTAVLTARFHVNFFLSVLVGILISIIAATVIGIILSRLKGDYYLLGTVSFNFIIVSLFLNLESITKGPRGIPGIPRPSLLNFDFDSNYFFVLFAVFLLVVVFLICRFIVRSSFGRALKAIREDEEALQVFGYRTLFYKVLVFVIAAGLASVAGSTYASYLKFVNPPMFVLAESVFMLAVVILGGAGSLLGSLLGAFILVLLPEGLRFVGFPTSIIGEMRQLIYGLIIVVLMMHKPEGLIGKYRL